MAEEDNMTYAWDNIDFQQLTDRLTGAANNPSDLIKLMEDLCQGDGDEEAAYDTAVAFLDYEFGPNGWFRNFVSVNESAMAKYQPATQDDREKFAYWEDLKIISEMCKKAYIGYSKLNKDLFLSCFRLIQAKVNMDDYNLDKSLYDKINESVKAITELLNKDPYSLSLPTHEKYVKDNKEAIEKDLIEKRDKDLKDYVGGSLKAGYVKYISTTEFGRQLTIDKELNRTRLPSNFDKMLHVVDVYTRNVAWAAGQDMGKLKESSQDFCDNGILINTKMKEMVKTPLCRSVAETLSRICSVFFRFTSLGHEYYEKYKNSSDAPFCFMKNVPALSNANGVGLSALCKDEPWKTDGTMYCQTFIVMLGAFRDYYKEVLEPARNPYVKGSFVT